MPRPASLIDGTVGVVVVAAGASMRMGGLDKVFADLGGEPVVARSVHVFETSPLVSRIVLVVSDANVERARQLVAARGWVKVTEVCAGGARRQDSVAAGLRRLDGCDWIMVHDGARPLISRELVERGLLAAGRWGAAVPGVPVKDTVKVVKDGLVQCSLDRSTLMAVQTPQVFKSGIIREAYARFAGDATDDASLVERLGQPVGIFEGSYVNMKITTLDDLAIARFLLEQEERNIASR